MTRENMVRERLEASETVLGARTETVSPLLVEVYGQLGYDFVWIDLEHGGPSPYDATAFDTLVRAAECADIELLVRVPHADPPLVHKVLDTGVKTLLVPRVEPQSRSGVLYGPLALRSTANPVIGDSAAAGQPGGVQTPPSSPTARIGKSSSAR